MSCREMSVVGSFYPNSAKEIERYIKHFEKVYDEHFVLPDIATRAVIVPHAGYVYSGFSAHIAYRLLAQSGVSNFVVIGPSHRVGFMGSSVASFNEYATPFGALGGDAAVAKELQEHFHMPQQSSAHREHSTEVQFALLKYYISHAKIVELVYSHETPQNISKVIEYVLAKEGWGVIISTDLSHFYTQTQANILDNICIEALSNLDTKHLHEGCEACGIIGVEAMMLSAQKRGLSPTILDYRTSADASGDESRVVGYLSAAFS